MQLRRFIRDAAGFAGTQYVLRMILMARGLIAAGLLGPAGYGAWNAISLLMEYAGQAPFGTLQGLDQTAPGRMVDGDRARVRRLGGAAMFNVIALGTLFALACVLYFSRSHGQIRTAWGLQGVVVVLACGLMTSVAQVYNSLLRSDGRIGAVSAWFLIQGGLGAVIGIALLPAAGAWGLLWGWSIGTVVALVFVHVQGRHLVGPPVPSADGGLMIRAGLPLFGSMAIAFLMRTLDRLIILRYLNTEALGHYSLAVMALGLLLYLPDSVAFVLYPRLLRRFRESGEDPAALRSPIERSTRALALALPVLCGLAYLAADDTVLWLLPRFRDGVPPLRILCFGAAALGLANVGAILLMTLRRQSVLVPASLIVSGLGAVGMILVAQAGFGIRGIAWVSLATYAVHSAILLSFAYATIAGSVARGLLMVVRELTPLAIAIPLAWICNTLLPGGGSTGVAALVRLGAGLVAFVTAYAVLVMPLARGIGLREVVRETPIPFLRGASPRGADS